MINKLKIYKSDSLNPYINLAIEKYLFDTILENTMILYLWQNEKTVVIGKNQNPWKECNLKYMEEENIRLARRLSGGGAVYHDIGNLNFSFIHYNKDSDVEKNFEIISRACKNLGINCEVSGRNDITADGKKFSGNAFYNSNKKCCHHGTLLVCADIKKMTAYLTPPKAKLTAKGIDSVKSRVINLSKLADNITCKLMEESMKKAFCDTFSLDCEVKTAEENDIIKKLSKEYESKDYLLGKTLPFSLSFEEYTPLGNFEICLDVSKGIISAAQIFTDSNNPDIAETLKNSLCGCNFNINDIKKSLLSSLEEEEFKVILSIFEKQKIFF